MRERSCANVRKSAYTVNEEMTPLKDITTYNNYYEFGTDKTDPSDNAHTLKTRPWTVAVEGEVKKPKVYDIEELLKLAPLEERIYRMRCVEGWSMVIPWVGYSVERACQARRAHREGEIRGVRHPRRSRADARRAATRCWSGPTSRACAWTRRCTRSRSCASACTAKCCRIQNGAPIRVVVPWKYGFKSGKSIVKIRFTEQQPKTSWNLAQPSEYGFYSNVNPQVDHPRWSQAKERRIGEFGKRPTLMFNGYADQVASLYTGMDLKKNF